MNPQQHSVSHTKALAGIVLLVLLGAACLSAGQWQLRRAHAREALLSAMTAGRQATPVQLDATHRDGPDWHPAAVSGRWLNQFTVLLDNRNLKGNPGLWVATPLELQDAAGTAVLVLRGWVARPLPPAQLPDLRAVEGPVTIQGTLLHQVPRLFDLGSLTGHLDQDLPSPFPAADGRLPRLQNLSLDTLEAATGLDLLPVVLEQAPAQDAGLTQSWPGPSVNPDQNYNYALQWFSFATIALGAAALMAWRLWRPRHPSTPPLNDSKP